MSSSTQNELQSEQSIGIIEPPADIKTRTIVENTARAVSKKGLDFERKLLDSNPNDARFNFLRSLADPCHAYYKRKLAEYIAQNQDDTDDSAIKIVLAPQHVTTTTIVDRMARLVTKFGSDFKLMVIDSNTDDARFNFLSSSADPYHALYQKKLALYHANPRDSYYQQKLTEYLVQNNNQKGATDVSDPMDIKIFHAPPDVRPTTIVDRAACLVSKYGWEFRLMVIASNINDARFRFLRMSVSDLHTYYLKRLAHYCYLNHDKVPDDEPYPQSQSRVQSQRLVLPNLLQCRLLDGMTLRELDTVKVTAQFVAWYGDAFHVELMERLMSDDMFEFMKPTDYRFDFFSEFVAAYSQVLHPPKDLKSKLKTNAAYMAVILEGFFKRIRWDSIQEYEWVEGGEKAMINWHVSVSRDFVDEDDQEYLPPPPELGMMQMPPPEPLPPPTFVPDDQFLVPEDQFLAQHPGLSTIRVICVPDGRVIKITVQSLSENLASLKEKIAGMVQISPSKQALSGKAGDLKDTNRSLAHYNVRPGAILLVDVVF